MQVLLNEVLYDPDGADGGYEFVELAAAPGGAADASLAGWVLETGNGSTGEWRVAWTGSAADRLRAGLFVIGESGVDPRPDVVADLDLQNGPDACRLRAPGGDADVLGWGASLPAGMYEAVAAEDVSGASLARFPDGVDTGDNAADFRGSPPTPRDYNAPASLVLAESVLLPGPELPPGSPFTFRAVLRNAGREPWSGDVAVECALHPAERLARFTVPAGQALLPGARVEVERAEWPPPGAHLPRAGGRADADLVMWRGAGEALLLTEAMSYPEADDPEWVEVWNASDADTDLGALELRDAAGGGGLLRGVLAAHGFGIVCADTAAFVARWGRPPARLVPLPSFPALNHTGSPGEVAERLTLRCGSRFHAAAAELLAEAALPGGAERGVSWERVSLALPAGAPGSWAGSLAPQGGTPGRDNSRPADRPVPASASALLATPRTFRPARDGGALLVWRTPPGASLGRFDVRDSAGRPVASLVPWLAAPGEQRAVWDGRDAQGRTAPLGLYLVGAEGGSARARTSVVLVP